jgi:Tfp pilus assembly protein PilO
MAMQTGLEGKPLYVSALVGLVLGAVAVGVGYQFKIKALNQDIVRQERRIQELDQKIQEGRAAQQQLPVFRETVRNLELELEKLLRILPARKNTPELLRRIRALVDQGNFGFRRFTPRGFSDRDFYSEWPIVINLTGGYHNLAQFFERISRFSRIINIEDLTISTSPGAGNQTIAAAFTAKTFVYKEPAPEPEPTDSQPRRGAPRR